MKSPKQDIDNNDILKYTQQLARKLEIKLPHSDVLVRNMRGNYPMPAEYHNDKYMIWLDKYYIAYSRHTEPKVHYVYLSKFHYLEEVRSYNKQCNIEKGIIWLPDSIKEAFSIARTQMSRNKQYYLDREFLQNIP